MNLIINKKNDAVKNFRAGILTSLFFAFLISLTIAASAKGPSVNARSDTSQIRIGEQFHLNLSATISKGMKITFPFLTDTFNHFEIVNKGSIDTTSAKDSKELTLQQQLTLTSFDSGFFVIPPMPFIISDNQNIADTFLTEAMLMTVITVPVDTTKEIRAIKNIIDVPFPWTEYLIYLLIALVIIGAAVYLYMRYKKREIKIFTPKIPERPAHEIALEGLRRIEEEKLWQQGFTKKYFSEVTDVVRQYIEHRFSIYAMEQTTDEILSDFKNNLVREEEKEKLTYILKLADMVKFAKALPLPSENENTIQFAYNFVNNTRPVIKEDFENKEEVK